MWSLKTNSEESCRKLRQLHRFLWPPEASDFLIFIIGGIHLMSAVTIKNTNKQLRSSMFIWSINNGNIAHLTFHKSPPGAFSVSLCEGVHMMSARPSCCPHSGEPVSSWVMAPSSDRLFLRLQNTHKDNGAHVGHTSSRHKHIFSWYYTNRQRMRHLHRGLLQRRRQNISFYFSPAGVIWIAHYKQLVLLTLKCLQHLLIKMNGKWDWCLCFILEITPQEV